MIRFRDALLLSSTKLRVRRVRQVLALLGAAVIFGVLAFAAFAVAGLSQSLGRYADTGYGNRLFVQLGNVEMNSKRVEARAIELQKADFEKRKAEARRKGEPEPVKPEGPGNEEFYFGPHTFYAQAMQELYPRQTLEQVRGRLGDLPVRKLYESRMAAQGSGLEMRVIKDGREQGKDDEKDESMGGFGGFGADPLASPMVTAMSRDLLEPFTVPGQSMARGKDGRIPILVPMDAAYKLTGTSIPRNATSREQISIKQEVRRKLAGSELQFCARNAEAIELLREARAQAAETAKNAGNKAYEKPRLQYSVPQAPCQPVGIARDLRTPAEKAFAAREKAEQGGAAPVTELLRFRVAGFVPALPQGAGDILNIATMLQTGPVGGYYFPLEERLATPLLTEAFEKGGDRGSTMIYAEAANRRDHKKIMAAGCPPFESFGPEGPTGCLEQGRWFATMNYGNPRISLEEMINLVKKGLLFALLILVSIAALLMWSTVAKVLADSRRETAVFRAIGARRVDILAIYVLYVLMLAAIAFVMALVLGAIGAIAASVKASPSLTVQAVEAFGAYEQQSPIILFGVNPLYLLAIFGLLVFATLLGSLLPLLLNLGRNPLKGMRDE